jgi:predicted AAA+ superfamily ATPase
MRSIPRAIEPVLARAARQFPAVVLTGPRRAGKTWLLRHVFPNAAYALLEDLDVIARVRADPQGFFDDLERSAGAGGGRPVILDEVQNVPEVFSYVRTRIDRQPRRVGRWLLTGSQESPLMQGVSESMAGRAAVLQLLPLSCRETDKVTPFLGGYPEVIARPAAARLWFSSYVQTYLERDVRREIYHFRDQQGLEVDFLVPGRGRLTMVECKAGRTVRPADAGPMQRLVAAFGKRRSGGPRTASPRMVVVHDPAAHGMQLSALAPGVQAMPWREIASCIDG